MMSTTLQTKTNLIKSINFTQFLNLLSALSELCNPKLFKTKPKRALTMLISDHFLPLLADIESRNGIKKYGL
jgi:hypothetical protein